MTAQKGQGGLSDPDLWTAISVAPLPGAVQPGGWFQAEKTLSFRDRLMAAHSLTDISALRLEDEYRRYLYLKAIDGGPLTPSTRVDQAWHLHIDTPGGEWGRFCDEVLGRRLVHHTGLSWAEASASYERLLALYHQEFRRYPPAEIWPGRVQKRRRAVGHGLSYLGVAVVLVSAVVLPMIGAHEALAWLGGIGGVGIAAFGGWIAKGSDLETVANCA